MQAFVASLTTPSHDGHLLRRRPRDGNAGALQHVECMGTGECVREVHDKAAIGMKETRGAQARGGNTMGPHVSTTFSLPFASISSALGMRRDVSHTMVGTCA